MSRIRSIHPGLWTDEAFMGLSAYARLLFIGLWNEAFDDGVFEWKPLTLKAKIFPVDGVDVPALLAELVAAGCVRACGKYGLIRNFRHFQRPKKPNSSGLLQPQDHEYVGLVPNQSPTNTEQDEQMEEGGDKMKEETESPPIAPVGGEAGDFIVRSLKAFPRSPHFNEAKFERGFRRLPHDQQYLFAAACEHYGQWFAEEQVRRKRSMAEALQFAPPLDKWLLEGAWRSALELPLNGQAAKAALTTKLDRERDRDLWLACERIMGKPAPTSGFDWSFRNDVIAQARAASSLDMGQREAS